METKFVYFDLDNTLLDHSSAEEDAHREIWQIYDELQDVELSDWVSVYKEINQKLWFQYQKGEVDRYQLHRSRFSDSMLTLDLSNERSEEIGSAYMQIYRKYWKWVDGAEKALVSVSEKYPIGFITNGFKETQQRKIDFLDLKRFGDLFIISEDVGVMKPHPRVFDIATERSKFNRNEIIYVGDSYSSDIIGGKNAGWKTAWFTALTEEFRECKTADLCFEKFPVLVDYLNH